MSIDEVRSSLNSDDRKKFDNAISNFRMADNVSHEVIDFTSPTDFVLKSTFDTKPYKGIVSFQDGNISVAIWFITYWYVGSRINFYYLFIFL